MTNTKELAQWPTRLRIRDTLLRDDIGGAGQRIYTTAGQGYEKREYVRGDLHEQQAARLLELEDIVTGLKICLADCPICSGSGVFSDHTCYPCQGKGKMTYTAVIEERDQLKAENERLKQRLGDEQGEYNPTVENPSTIQELINWHKFEAALARRHDAFGIARRHRMFVTLIESHVAEYERLGKACDALQDQNLNYADETRGLRAALEYYAAAKTKEALANSGTRVARKALSGEGE